MKVMQGLVTGLAARDDIAYLPVNLQILGGGGWACRIPAYQLEGGHHLLDCSHICILYELLFFTYYC